MSYVYSTYYQCQGCVFGFVNAGILCVYRIVNATQTFYSLGTLTHLTNTQVYILREFDGSMFLYTQPPRAFKVVHLRCGFFCFTPAKWLNQNGVYFLPELAMFTFCCSILKPSKYTGLHSFTYLNIVSLGWRQLSILTQDLYILYIYPIRLY